MYICKVRANYILVVVIFGSTLRPARIHYQKQMYLIGLFDSYATVEVLKY